MIPYSIVSFYYNHFLRCQQLVCFFAIQSQTFPCRSQSFTQITKHGQDLDDRKVRSRNETRTKSLPIPSGLEPWTLCSPTLSTKPPSCCEKENISEWQIENEFVETKISLSLLGRNLVSLFRSQQHPQSPRSPITIPIREEIFVYIIRLATYSMLGETF